MQTRAARGSISGFSGFSSVEPPRTAGITDKNRPPPLSREQPIGIGTGGRHPPGAYLDVCMLGVYPVFLKLTGLETIVSPVFLVRYQTHANVYLLFVCSGVSE